jgi:hypothetical protein
MTDANRLGRYDDPSAARERSDEISFFQHRLEVISRWPPSDRRNALLAATLHRLRTLGFDDGNGSSAATDTLR